MAAKVPLPPIDCEYPLHCEVELDQWSTLEGTIEGDLNCAIDAFVDRGSGWRSCGLRRYV
jgi:hypothetical protein